MGFKIIEIIHKKIDQFIGGRKHPFIEDLLDVIFSPNYGLRVVKLEVKHFYKHWLRF